VPKHGNSLVVQLVLNGMKLQTCRPSFFEARDAIIQADQVLTGGENFCTLWEGFSEKGLGQDATVVNRTPWGGGIRTNVRLLFHTFINDCTDNNLHRDMRSPQRALTHKRCPFLSLTSDLTRRALSIPRSGTRYLFPTHHIPASYPNITPRTCTFMTIPNFALPRLL